MRKIFQKKTLPSFFWGGGVENIPEVQRSKLTEEEKNYLEQPLTIEELDASIKKAKLKSSCGIDGISNKFIAHFWNFFRKPLLKCPMLLQGEICVAKIRLIPKKGGRESIKNWRPISLLNCFYKIISRHSLSG